MMTSAISSPAVSVLMAVYNGGSCLEDAIKSILQQTHTDFELIIVNDASTDQSKNIITDFTDPRVRYFENERNLGLTVTLNHGLRKARGRLVARQDADDISVRHRLKRQVEFMTKHPAIALLGTYYVPFDESGTTYRVMKPSTDPAVLKWQMLFHNKIGHSTVMFRRDIVKQYGGYDECFRLNQDYALWSRLMFDHEIAILPELYVYRRNRKEDVELTYDEDSVMSPACLISVDNLKRLTDHQYPQKTYVFLHALLGSCQLPARGQVIRDHISEVDFVINKFVHRFHASSFRGRIHQDVISRLLIFVSFRYSLRQWWPILMYMLSSDFFLTLRLLIKKVVRKISSMWRNS